MLQNPNQNKKSDKFEKYSGFLINFRWILSVFLKKAATHFIKIVCRGTLHRFLALIVLPQLSAFAPLFGQPFVHLTAGNIFKNAHYFKYGKTRAGHTKKAVVSITKAT